MGVCIPQAGDVCLSQNPHDFVAWGIRFAESRRYGRNSEEAKWNHAFMVVDGTSGDIVEARAHGVEKANLTEYTNMPYVVLRPPYASAMTQSRAISEMLKMVGSKYGYVTIACEALAFLTQTKFRFGVAGQHICSGAVSHALELAGLDMGDDAEWNSPADVMHIGDMWPRWRWVPESQWFVQERG